MHVLIITSFFTNIVPNEMFAERTNQYFKQSKIKLAIISHMVIIIYTYIHIYKYIGIYIKNLRQVK